MSVSLHQRRRSTLRPGGAGAGYHNTHRLSTASQAFHSHRTQRFSRVGSMMGRKSMMATPEGQSISYAKQAFTGQPTNLANEKAKLEELKEMQEQMDHKTTVEERKLNFLAALMSEKKTSSEHAGIRIFLFDFIENDGLDTIIMTLILLNSFLIFLRGMSYESILKYGYLHDLLEPVFLAFYVWEAIVKIVVYKSQYFSVKDDNTGGHRLKGWNIFDFLIVIISLIDFIASTVSVFTAQEDNLTTGMQTQYFKMTRFLKSVRMLKSLRSLRIMRVLKMIEETVTLLDTICKSLRSMVGVLLMLMLFIMVFALFGLQLFSSIQGISHFSSMSHTFFTLIQVLTMDDWFRFVTEIHVAAPDHANMIFLYLFAYQFLTYFICLNLFIAVLVDSFQLTMGTQYAKAKLKQEVKKKEDEITKKVEGDLVEISDENLRARLARLNELMGGEGEDDDDYESSESEEDPDMVNEQVIENIKTANASSTTEAISTSEWYFRILCSIEKNYNILRDQQSTHDRVIDLMVDGHDEMNK